MANTPKWAVTLKNGIITTGSGGHKRVDYLRYIDENPLYLHNHKNYYIRTVNKIKSEKYGLYEAEQAAINYIKYLESREKNLLERIGGPEILELLMAESFGNNAKIKEVLDYLNNIFGKNSGYRASVSGKKVLITPENPRGIENMFHITHIDTGKSFKVALEYAGKKKSGATKYNYEKALKDIHAEGKKYVEIMGNNIINAFKEKGELTQVLKDIIDKEVLDASVKSAGMQDYLRLVKSKKITAETLLELIIASAGPFNTYSGIYPEAIKTVYEDSLIQLFKEVFKNPDSAEKVELKRNATLLETVNKDGQQILKWIDKLSKTDMYIEYDFDISNYINPITISRKVTQSKNIKNFKIQDDVTLNTMYNAFAKEDEKIAKVYKYLTINNAFWSSWNGFDSVVFNRIIRYMSFVFLSGGTNLGNSGSLSNVEFNKDKALYLVYTKPNGDNFITNFLPMSVIFKKLLLGKSSENSGNLDRAITITNTKRNNNDITKLWSLKEEATRINKKKNNWKYEILSKNSDVEEEAKEVAKNILDSKRKAEIKIDFLDYLVQHVYKNGNLF